MKIKFKKLSEYSSKKREAINTWVQIIGVIVIPLITLIVTIILASPPTITDKNKTITLTPTLIETAIVITPTSTTTNTYSAIDILTRTTTVTKTSIPTKTDTPTIIPTATLEKGATQVREKDNMVMVYVPAGSFIMGSDGSEKDEQPKHEVYLDAYWIDKYEVTNAQYAMCVADGDCLLPSKDISNARNGYYNYADYANYPVIWVNLDNAKDYCKWAGGSLPTEAQWEKAARGTDGRTYPWGEDSPTCNLANYTGCVGDTNAVGSYPEGASPYGVLDMAGNVWEWVADYYDENYYGKGPVENPSGPYSGAFQVTRGGSWENSEFTMRGAYRFGISPYTVGDNYGFRCAFPASE